MMLKKILLIDDTEEFRMLLREALIIESYEVSEADDGYGGLAKLAEGEVPDLIITDVHMPTMDGMQFLKTLRKNHKFSEMPVLVCSHDSMFCDLSIGLGNVRCTGKDIETILAMIRST